MGKTARRAALLSVTSIPAVFLLFYGIHGGMPWDYSLTYLSESTPGIAGFLYRGDSLRIFTNVFYNIGYLLSEALSAQGSWIGYHLIYCVLWSAKAALVYWFCSLFELGPVIALAAALIAVSHGSDTSIGHVGQINQFGIIFWILLSMCHFLAFLRHEHILRYGLLAVSVISSCFGLWSYEGTLFVLLIFPTLFLWATARWKESSAIFGAVLVTSPALVYSGLITNRLLIAKLGNTYQESVLRSDIHDIGALMGDYFRLLKGLVYIPGWIIFKLNAFNVPITSLASKQFLVPATLALLAAACSSILIAKASCRAEEAPIESFWRKQNKRRELQIAFVLFCLASASILPFLALEHGGGYWRTQIIAGPFASILMAMILYFLIVTLPRYVNVASIAARASAFATALVAIAMCGFAANAITYRFYNKQWEQIRAPIQRALAAVPSIKPGTVIMLQDVPVGSAAWGDNFWFDILMRLAYPKTLVAGSYSFDVKKATSKDITNIVRSGGEIYNYKMEGKYWHKVMFTSLKVTKQDF